MLYIFGYYTEYKYILPWDSPETQLYIHLFQSGSGHPAARAIIGPHAGYKYCGACGGYAYSRIDPTNVKRVFILGPSHHVRLNGCAVSGCVKVINSISVSVVS